MPKRQKEVIFMNIMIFDTETAGTSSKPFAYNVGYVIYNTDTKETLVSKDFVAEQVWHNNMLFSSAYYAEKRPLYVNSMRAKKTKMTKFGYICQEMIRDIKAFDVSSAYAYNSPFDENVFNYNCDWYKCANPFDNIPIFDIRGYVHSFLVNEDYLSFCEKNECFTEKGNYSTTAETAYQYITNNPDFKEEHTALADSLIERDILVKTLELGAELETAYKVKSIIPRNVDKEMKIFLNRMEVAKFTYTSKLTRNDNIYLTKK